MFSSIGLSEILLILLITLVVIGPEKLPQVARMLGKGLREMRRASNMFRDMFLLDDATDFRHPQFADESATGELATKTKASDASPWAVSGTVARDGYVRPAIRPVLLDVTRRATHTTEVALAPAAESTDACTFEELSAPRG